MTQNTKTFEQLVLELDELQSRRIAWQDGALKTSNEQLYELLECCLNIYLQLADDVRLRRKLTKLLTSRGNEFNASASLETKIIEWVFGDCGTRRSVYSRVVKVAVKSKPENESMITWINSKGGIENIRRSSKGGESPKSRTEVFNNAVEHFEKSKSLAVIQKKIDELAPNPTSTHEYSIALLRKGKTHASEVVYGTNNQSLVRTVLIAAGRDASASKAAIDTEDQAASKQQSTERAISEVLADSEVA